MKTENPNQEKKSQEKKSEDAGFSLPFGDPKEMVEMMKQCCPGEEGFSACCSRMKKMMGAGKKEEEPRKTGEPPTGGEKA
jgi:hypothetical protein